jgi:hypothetical protein
MLLGMLFVFSKQYSDDLSNKVSRGVNGNFDDGKSSGSPKWGYDRSNINGLYEPNEFFDLMQSAWTKRNNGQTNAEIVRFLIQRGYHRMTKLTKKNKLQKKDSSNRKKPWYCFSRSFLLWLISSDKTNYRPQRII